MSVSNIWVREKSFVIEKNYQYKLYECVKHLDIRNMIFPYNREIHTFTRVSLKRSIWLSSHFTPQLDYFSLPKYEPRNLTLQKPSATAYPIILLKVSQYLQLDHFGSTPVHHCLVLALLPSNAITYIEKWSPVNCYQLN